MLSQKFAKAETLVQEITADGKVRDIVTERKKTEADVKDEAIRNLPEFRLQRGEGTSLSQQLADQKNSGFVEDKDKEQEPTTRAIDEDEAEHYQLLEDKEREKTRLRAAEDREALVDFEHERKRLRADGDAPAPDLLSAMQQKNRERAAAKAKSAPTAADRLRGRVVVRSRAASETAAAAPQAPAQAAQPVQGAIGGGLVGYDSDSDE
mmetsp:Transcript_42628/g.74897  ORF Transcript_42628/g.74897 Transcript_42628/m.74897 type:complete len:208 (+) Transcript_42628:107-730(+)